MANGGLIAQSGTHMIALAAKYYNVPFVVCTGLLLLLLFIKYIGLYKLSPLYPFDQDTYNDVKSPAAVLKFEEGEYIHSFES